MSDPTCTQQATISSNAVDDTSINQWMSEQDMTKLQAMQYSDPDLRFIIDALKTGVRPSHSEVVSRSPTLRYYWSIWKSLTMHHGCLHRYFHRQDNTGSYLQFIVPTSLKGNILYQMHNSILSGHLGRKKTIE